MNVRLVAVLGLVLGTAGCAALFNQSTTPVQLNSNPSGVEVFMDGNRLGTTPLQVDLTVAEGHNITFRHNGSEVTCMINKKIGLQWVVLDVLGGLVPIVVDAATGSWYELDRTVCNANFGEMPEVDWSQVSPEMQESFSGTL